MDKGERQPIVQPGLRGQGETHRVLAPLGGPTHLNITGQHRVGWGQDRPQEKRARERQSRGLPADEGDAGDGERHADRKKADRGRPESGCSQSIDPHSHAEQTDNQAYFADGFPDARRGDRADGLRQLRNPAEDRPSEADEQR